MRSKEIMSRRHTRIFEKELAEAQSATSQLPLRDHVDAALENTDGKSPDHGKFLLYAAAFFTASAATAEFRARPVWRKNLFRRQQADKKCTLRFSRRIRELYGDDVVLFLGSQYTKAQAKFMPPTKGIGLYRDLRALGHTIFLVDEYMTSQVSFRTGTGEGLSLIHI